MAVLRRVRQRSPLVTSCWSDVWNCNKMVIFVWCKLKPRISWLDNNLSQLESSQKEENDEQLNRKLCESQPIKNEGLKFSWHVFWNFGNPLNLPSRCVVRPLQASIPGFVVSSLCPITVPAICIFSSFFTLLSSSCITFRVPLHMFQLHDLSSCFE